MLYIDIITILPELFDCYFRESILKRAQEKRFALIAIHNLRNWTKDKHRTVDDRPYGGGAGMIFKVEPVFKAVNALKRKRARLNKRKVILFSAGGFRFTQRIAERFSALEHLILICGRYEGVDGRVAKYIADMELSIGPYVLTGGEAPAMVVADAVTRLIPGVIRPESLIEESFALAISHKPYAISPKRPTAYSLLRTAFVGEYPQYTRPEFFYPDYKNKKIVWRAPKVLLSGDHEKIAAWRKTHMCRVD